MRTTLIILGLSLILMSGCNPESEANLVLEISDNLEVAKIELAFEGIYDYGFNPNYNYGELGFRLNYGKAPSKIIKE